MGAVRCKFLQFLIIKPYSAPQNVVRCNSLPTCDYLVYNS